MTLKRLSELVVLNRRPARELELFKVYPVDATYVNIDNKVSNWQGFIFRDFVIKGLFPQDFFNAKFKDFFAGNFFSGNFFGGYRIF